LSSSFRLASSNRIRLSTCHHPTWRRILRLWLRAPILLVRDFCLGTLIGSLEIQIFWLCVRLSALEVDLKKMHNDFIQVHYSHILFAFIQLFKALLFFLRQSDKASSDLQRARKESENIQRREYLEKAKQFVFASREREAQFWASQDNKCVYIYFQIHNDLGLWFTFDV
jgi:hypothetical protein